MGTELRKTVEFEALTPDFPYMPKGEWESRVNKARELMETEGLNAIMILNNDDRLYFFGCAKQFRYAFPNAGIIPLDGPTTLIMDSGEARGFPREGYAKRVIGYRGDTQAPTPVSPDPVKLMVEVMEDLGLGNKTIGMEFGPFMWWEGFNMNQWEQFKSELPEAKFVDATDIIWQMRMIKSDWEIEVMKHLYRASGKGYFQIINNAKPGKNETELFYDALRVWIEEGIIDSLSKLNVLVSHGGVRSGIVGGIGHYRDRILNEGDRVFLDGGPCYKGYSADIQRAIYIGDPGKEVRRVARLAEEAFYAVEQILKPGTTTGQIWTTAIAKVAEGEAAIWSDMRSPGFISFCGHGEGLNLQEPPYICEGSDIELKEGMVIALEIPAFYHGSGDYDGAIVNMPEDVYLITKDGFENLSKDLGPISIYIKT